MRLTDEKKANLLNYSYSCSRDLAELKLYIKNIILLIYSVKFYSRKFLFVWNDYFIDI